MRNKHGFLLTAICGAVAGCGAWIGGNAYGSFIRAKRAAGEGETAIPKSLQNACGEIAEIRLNAVDQLPLYGLWIKAQDDTHDYVLFIRDTAQTASDSSEYARHYCTEKKYHVIVPDLRGCGKSEGNYYGYGYDDRLDIISWVHWILKRDPKARILLHGLGAGANACLMAGAEHMPPAVYAIVSDSAFTSLRAYLIRVLDDADSIIPVFLRLFLLRIATKLLAGYDILTVSPLDAVKKLGVPTLFLHGDADRLIPVEMCKKLYEEARCTRQIGVFLGADHLKSEQTQKERYWKQVDSFLMRQHPKRL